MARFNRHFETAALRSNLQRRSLQSSLITFGSQPIKLVLGIGSTSVLARLLTPADFGLVAMALPLFALFESVNALGLGIATVQQEHLDHQQASTIFWLSSGINALLIAGVLLLTPLFAQFYQESRLTVIIPALALGMGSVFLAVQHQSLLARQMRFGTLTVVEVGALALGSGAAIAAALLGWGYWALVLQLVVMQVAQSISLWLVCGWRPARPHPLVKLSQATRSMLFYGANLSAFQLINRVGMEMDRVLVGYVNGANALGLYAVAYNWASFSFNQVYWPLMNVAIAGLSRAANDADQYRRQVRQIVMLTLGLSLPALAFLGVCGPDLLLLLLGNQWVEAFPIFRVLLLYVAINAFYRIGKWIYLSTGQADRQLRWSLLHTPVVVVAASLGTRWGPLGVSWGITLASLLLTYPAMVYCLRHTPLTLGQFISSVWRPVLASIAAAGLLFTIRMGVELPGLAGLNLLLSAIAFTVAYAAAFVLLPGGWRDLRGAYRDFKALACADGDP